MPGVSAAAGWPPGCASAASLASPPTARERLRQAWPGVTSLDALLHGGEIEGVWFDRTAEWKAKRRGEELERYDHARTYSFPLSPLPHWEHLAPTAHQDRAAAMSKEITYHHRERRRAAGKTVLGVKRIRRAHPPLHPQKARPVPRSPVSRREAGDPGHARASLERQYQEFASTYREAPESLRAGRPYRFPGGCFPPALPFQPNRPPPFAPAG